MEIWNKIEEGWPSTLDPRRTIAAITRPDWKIVHYKIGITDDPKRRSREYEREGDYNEMILLYKTTSHINAAKLENYLVEHFMPHDRCDNATSGGAGRWDRDAYYHYLYIVLKRL